MSASQSIEARVRRYAKSYRSAAFRAAGGIGVLAEGDSWFTWPLHPWEGPTLVAALEQRRRGERPVAAVSVANPGAHIATMASHDNEDLALACNVDWLGRRGSYDAVLLSAGGNDMLDDASLRELLPHPSQRDPGTRYEHGFLDRARFEVRLAAIARHYRWLFANLPPLVFALPGESAQPARRLPILVHGYADAVPRNTAKRFLGIVGVGPWLGRRMTTIGVPTATQRVIARTMVGAFNTMLSDLADETNAKANARAAVRYLDLRGEIGADDFDDEIHLRTAARRRVAHRFAAELYEALPGA